LSIDHPAIDPALAGLIAEGERQRALEEQQIEAQASAADNLPLDPNALPGTPALLPVPPEIQLQPAAPEKAPRPVSSALTVQFASPDGPSVDAALTGLRGTPKVSSATTSSIAIGGTSVMRVNYAGSVQELAAELRQRGWQVTIAGNVLRIRR
jgi:hypothetical protein